MTTNFRTLVSAIENALDRYTDAALDVENAKQQLDDARKSMIGARDGILIDLGSVSIKLLSTVADIKDAVPLAVKRWAKGNKRTPATIAQFEAECRRAMHPKVRAHVAPDINITIRLWPYEPLLRQAYGKRYHVAAGSNGMFAARIKDNPDAADPRKLARAILADPKRLARKATKEKELLGKALDRAQLNMPHGQLLTLLRARTEQIEIFLAIDALAA